MSTIPKRRSKVCGGMMRFANYDSPLLLEALASLLCAGHKPDWDARQLAARALLQASYKTQDAQSLRRLPPGRQTRDPYARRLLPGEARSRLPEGARRSRRLAQER